MKLEEKMHLPALEELCCSSTFGLLFSRAGARNTWCGVSAVCLHTFCNAWEGCGSYDSSIHGHLRWWRWAWTGWPHQKAGRIRSCIKASDSCGRPSLTNRRRTSQVPNLTSPWVLSSTLDLNLNGCHVLFVGGGTFTLTGVNDQILGQRWTFLSAPGRSLR